MNIFVIICLFCLYKVKGECPPIQNRTSWNANPPEYIDAAGQSLPFAIIHHSATQPCTNNIECAKRIKAIQVFHQKVHKWTDIGYNFIVGGDGNIYEGRGWNVIGAHARGYNSRSIGICFIGNYMEYNTSKVMLQLAKDLLDCAVDEDHLSANYTLFGHRQVKSTLCPGNKLQNKIETWPHFVKKV